jgi:radical SAM protein with 4Fe4S-binding SPASM domain
LHAELLPSDKCNQKCVWCRGGPRCHFPEGNELSRDVMCSVGDELKEYNLKGIVRFSGVYGEPLVNEGTLPAILHYTNLGLRTALTTNGILLTPKTHYFLGGDSMEYVSVSLDAGSQHTFNILKGHTDHVYDAVISNLESLAAFRAKHNRKFRMTIGYIIHKENYREIPAAAALLRDIGIDAMQVKVPWPTKEAVFTENERKGVEDAIAAASGCSTERFKFVPMQTPQERWDELGGRIPKANYERCYAQFLNAVFGPDGNVYPCAHYFNNDGTAAEPFGNVNQTSFKAIWEGEKRRKAIAAIVPRDQCKYCNRYDKRMNSCLVGKGVAL